MPKSRIEEFLQGAASRPYRKLIEHHMRQQSAARLGEAATQEASSLPECTQDDLVRFVDALNARLAYDQSFWRNATCGQALEVIVETATETLPLGEAAEKGLVGYLLLGRGKGEQLPPGTAEPESHALAFSLFQVATLSFAYSASMEKRQRKFMGIRKGWFDPHIRGRTLLVGLVYFLIPGAILVNVGFWLKGSGGCVGGLGWAAIALGVLLGFQGWRVLRVLIYS